MTVQSTATELCQCCITELFELVQGFWNSQTACRMKCCRSSLLLLLLQAEVCGCCRNLFCLSMSGLHLDYAALVISAATCRLMFDHCILQCCPVDVTATYCDNSEGPLTFSGFCHRCHLDACICLITRRPVNARLCSKLSDLVL